MEAINLLKFYKNFEGLHQTVVWPKLIPDLVSNLATTPFIPMNVGWKSEWVEITSSTVFDLWVEK